MRPVRIDRSCRVPKYLRAKNFVVEWYYQHFIRRKMFRLAIPSIPFAYHSAILHWKHAPLRMRVNNVRSARAQCARGRCTQHSPCICESHDSGRLLWRNLLYTTPPVGNISRLRLNHTGCVVCYQVVHWRKRAIKADRHSKYAISIQRTMYTAECSRAFSHCFVFLPQRNCIQLFLRQFQCKHVFHWIAWLNAAIWQKIAIGFLW